jgi:hypothetical protein
VVLGNEHVTAVYMGEDSGATVYAASFVCRLFSLCNASHQLAVVLQE